MDSTKSSKKRARKGKPKSRQQKMVEMRLKQWYNSSYKKLQVETFFYLAKNGESLKMKTTMKTLRRSRTLSVSTART